jgi:hypothetical protein
LLDRMITHPGTSYDVLVGLVQQVADVGDQYDQTLDESI